MKQNRSFVISTRTEDRGEVCGTRADAVSAARTMSERSGEKHYSEAKGSYVTDGKGTRIR